MSIDISKQEWQVMSVQQREQHLEDTAAKFGQKVKVADDIHLWALQWPAGDDIESKRQSPSPTLIFLHGSGAATTSLLAYKSVAAALLEHNLSVLLYDRRGHGESEGNHAQSPLSAAQDLQILISSISVPGPYILVAHSAGGAVAKAFLLQKKTGIAGMILVETGQETALADRMERKLYQYGGIMGSHPLTVIRGNSLRNRQKHSGIQNSGSGAMQNLDTLSESWDLLHDQLKRAQLRMSRRARFIHLTQTGHGVPTERPEVVVEEILEMIHGLDLLKQQGMVQRFFDNIACLMKRQIEEVRYDKKVEG